MYMDMQYAQVGCALTCLCVLVCAFMHIHACLCASIYVHACVHVIYQMTHCLADGSGMIRSSSLPNFDEIPVNVFVCLSVFRQCGVFF